MIKFIKVCLFLFVITLGSCSKNQEVIPDSVLKKEKMVLILSDLHLLEAQVQMSNYNQNDSTKLIVASAYKDIFLKNKVEAKQFQRSYEYYQVRPELMSEIYKDVITELSRRQASGN
jgi:Domain of unknown function (DUF4296)